jgi:protein transport protein SEC24
MSAFHGNFFVRSTDLLSLPAVPMDQSYAIEIQIEDPISAPFVVFQTAVLHTTCYGERRIRVVTLALPTTSSISELYASVDTVALATLLANKAVERSTQSKLEDARDAVSNKLVDILGTYKATMTSAGSGASPQLVIADNMKFLPLLMLGLLKNVSLFPLQLVFPEESNSSDARTRRPDWFTTQHDDTFRRTILRSSTAHDSPFPTSRSLPSPSFLLTPQHAERSEFSLRSCSDSRRY